MKNIPTGSHRTFTSSGASPTSCRLIIIGTSPCAPRPFIALEGDHDQNVNQNGVKQSWLAAQPAYALFGKTDQLGVSWADRPHGMVAGDWDALLAFADKFLLGKKIDRQFDQFPKG